MCFYKKRKKLLFFTTLLAVMERLPGWLVWWLAWLAGECYGFSAASCSGEPQRAAGACWGWVGAKTKHASCLWPACSLFVDADHAWIHMLALMTTTLIQRGHVNSVADYDPLEPFGIGKAMTAMKRCQLLMVTPGYRGHVHRVVIQKTAALLSR